MSKRLYHHNKVKYGRSYDKDDICALFDIHPQTVQAWIKKQGLKTIDNKKPSLVYGWDLIEFLKRKNNKDKCPTQFNEMYCFQCSLARPIFKKSVRFEEKHNGLFVQGRCRQCKSVMSQNYKLKDFQKIKRIFNVVDVLELYDCEQSTCKTHICDHVRNNPSEPSQGVLPL
jgi:hypothetical protein